MVPDLKTTSTAIKNHADEHRKNEKIKRKQRRRRRETESGMI